MGADLRVRVRTLALAASLLAVLAIGPAAAASNPYVVVHVVNQPSLVAAAGASVWVVGCNGLVDSGVCPEYALREIDERAAGVVSSVSIQGGEERDPLALAYGFGTRWVSTLRGEVMKIDPSSRTVVARIAVRDGPRGIAVGSGAIWVATLEGGLVRIDAATSRITRTVDLGRRGYWVAFGGGAVWAAVDGKVVRIDPSTGHAVARFSPRGGAEYVAAGAGQVWVATRDGAVGRVDAAHGRLTARRQVAKPTGSGSPPLIRFAIGRGSVWATDFDATALQLDARTGRPRRTLTFWKAAYANAVAVGYGRTWIADFGGDSATGIL